MLDEDFLNEAVLINNIVIMKEYKFRGKRKLNGKWVFGSYINLGEDWCQIVTSKEHCDGKPEKCVRVISETVGIFTHLEDKNGIDVYPGDLREIEGKLYKVVNHGWQFMFERNMVEFGENEDVLLDEDTAWESFYRGNIFDNKELLYKP